MPTSDHLCYSVKFLTAKTRFVHSKLCCHTSVNSFTSVIQYSRIHTTQTNLQDRYCCPSLSVKQQIEVKSKLGVLVCSKVLMISKYILL